MEAEVPCIKWHRTMGTAGIPHPQISQLQTKNTVFNLRRGGGENRGDRGPAVVLVVVVLLLVVATVTVYSPYPLYYILGF